MPALYSLTAQYLEMADQLFDQEADQDAVLRILADMQGDIETKMLNTARVIKNAEGDIASMKAEEERLASRRRALDSKIKGLKRGMQDAMVQCGIAKVKDGCFTVAIQNNPPSVNILDDRAIPDDYLIPQPSQIDKRHVLEALKAGEVVPGAELVQGQSLRIK